MSCFLALICYTQGRHTSQWNSWQSQSVGDFLHYLGRHCWLSTQFLFCSLPFCSEWWYYQGRWTQPQGVKYDWPGPFWGLRFFLTVIDLGVGTMTHSNQRHKGISTLARGFLEQFLLFCHLCLLSQQYVILGATAATLWSWGWSQENHREAETEPWCCWAAKSPRHFLLDFQLCEIRYVLIVKSTSTYALCYLKPKASWPKYNIQIISPIANWEASLFSIICSIH